MLQIEDTKAGYLHISVDGELDASDYRDFVPRFEALARAKSPPLPMLIELGSQFSGWSLAGLWQELKFDLTHAEVFGPIAVVGDNRWERWGTEVSDPFFNAELRYFETAHKHRAESWLTERCMKANDSPRQP